MDFDANIKIVIGGRRSQINSLVLFDWNHANQNSHIVYNSVAQLVFNYPHSLVLIAECAS